MHGVEPRSETAFGGDPSERPQQIAQTATDEMTLGATPEEIGAREHFEKLYANWLSARAALYAEQADESDAAASERQDRIDEAARELLATPAPLSWAVWFKWEILEDWAAGHGCADKWIDNRVTFALGCIKADSIGVMD